MISFTGDPRINKHIAKLNQVEEELEKQGNTTDINEMSVDHAIALDDQKILRERIERESLAFGVKNPLQEKEKPQNILQSNSSFANNKSMGISSQNSNLQTGQYQIEAAAAAERYQDPHHGYEKPFPETKVPQTRPVVRQPVSQLKASDNLRGHLKKWEGYSHTVQDDGSGNPTGGYGNVTPGSTIGDHVGRQKARQLITQDIKIAEAGVKRLVGNLPLSQNEYDALVDLYFNVGETKMNDPKNSVELRKAILVGDYTRMGDQLLYSLEDGVPSQGLVNRSNSRKDLFKYGIYGRRYP